MSKEVKPEKKRNEVIINAKTKEEGQKLIAEVYLNPLFSTANTLLNIHKSEDAAIVPLVEVLGKKAAAIRKNDFSDLENMLTAQAYLLDAIFTEAARKLVCAQHLTGYQTYGNMAMKAQNLCRMTLATLADIKNPARPTIIKNTAHNQQVNIGETNPPKSSNELLSEDTPASPPGTPQIEHQHHETMDTGRAIETGRADKEVETVEISRS